MTPDSSSAALGSGSGASSFRVSSKSLIPDGSSTRTQTAPVDQLPQSYDVPVIVILPRNPKNFFAFWDLNWAALTPAGEERRVELRIFGADGVLANSVTVEPMSGTAEVTVEKPGGSYYVELGFSDANDEWKMLARSAPTEAPADAAAADDEADFASVPFHLAFQRLTEIFAKAAVPGEGVMQTTARVEAEAADPGSRTPSTQESSALAVAGITPEQVASVLRVYGSTDRGASTGNRAFFWRELARISTAERVTSPRGGLSSASQPPPR